MSRNLSRRTFVKTSALAGVALAACHTSTALAEPDSANETVNVAVMGVNGRGTALAQGFASLANCKVTFIADVDERAIPKAVSAAQAKQQLKPEPMADFRKALENANVHALVVAAPNHWHAPATILAAAAGKHVYVEKPCCHNP